MLIHTPYVGRAQPFSIGLRPIAQHSWISPDALLLPELARKIDILKQHRNVVVRWRDDTGAAQRELLNMLAGHLLEVHGGIFRRTGDIIRIGEDGPSVDLAEGAEPAIVKAARLIQDDLVLMRKCDDGWRLVAACLCFPSNWSLAEKFDLPMEAIHESVPGYAGQMTARINRIFDHLPQNQIVERFNWSIQNDEELHHPGIKARRTPWRGRGPAMTEQAFVRVERQTLRRLPVAGDIVFTIKIHVDPVLAFRDHPDGKVLAAALRDQLAGLDEAELAYKNMLLVRDGLIEGLTALAGA
jgi:dimethylamine monooxygenase subunit A